MIKVHLLLDIREVLVSGLITKGISETIEIGQSRLIHQGSDLLIISIGRMLDEAKQVAEKIKRI